jgi:hypothetical protein
MKSRTTKLIGLSILGLFLFNFPILGIFKKLTWAYGIPSVFLYLFTVWALFVIMIWFLVEPINYDKYFDAKLKKSD